LRRLAPLALAALAAACGAPEGPGELRVFAAASLTEVMREITAGFERETGATVRLNLAASSVLARQIVEGARCDVFISADPEGTDFVERAGLLEPGTRRDLLSNELALVRGEGVVPPPGLSIDRPEDAVANAITRTEGRIAMGDPSYVPAGRYARTALQALGVWDQAEPRIVPCESVRAALALAERGEVEYAVVYWTDARISSRRLSSKRFPEVPGVAIRYPVAGLKGLSVGGRSFLARLEGPDAVAAFRRAGFVVPAAPR